MIEPLLKIIAPHYCYSCQKIGTILCDNCKYNIVNEVYYLCILCLCPSEQGICTGCRRKAVYSRAWMVGNREGVLQKLLDDYKFERVRAAYYPLAQLLHEYLPRLPDDTIVTPIPTIAPHIRQRGYDHCLLIARELARLRHLPFSSQALRRHSHAQQRGKSKSERKQQAATMFTPGKVQQKASYLIVDDIFTTGATLNAAAKTLKYAGAARADVSVIARQMLD